MDVCLVADNDSLQEITPFDLVMEQKLLAHLKTLLLLFIYVDVEGSTLLILLGNKRSLVMIALALP